jgi:hypothetical protein
MSPLILKLASASRSSGQWSDDDYDVLENGVAPRGSTRNHAPRGVTRHYGRSPTSRRGDEDLWFSAALDSSTGSRSAERIVFLAVLRAWWSARDAVITSSRCSRVTTLPFVRATSLDTISNLRRVGFSSIANIESSTQDRSGEDDGRPDRH